MQLVKLSVKELGWAHHAMFTKLQEEADARDISVANFVPPSLGHTTLEKFVIDIMEPEGIWEIMMTAAKNGGMSRVKEFEGLLGSSDLEDEI